MIAALLAVALAQAQPHWPALQVLSVVDVDGAIEVGRRSVRLQRIRVKEPLDQVLRVFLKSFDDAGLYVPPAAEQLQLYRGSVTLTALDPVAMRSFTVTVWKASDGSSELISGQASLVQQPLTGAGLAQPLLPQSASSVFHTSDEGHQTCSFSTTQSVDEVIDEMRLAAGRSGFEVEPRAGAWLFVKGAVQIEARVQRDRGVTRVVMLVYTSGAQ